MKALIQRVNSASVEVGQELVGEISKGLLLFLGVEQGDTQAIADKLLAKVLRYRVFSDELDKMNLSLLDVCGDLLVVSQFTLVANTQKGLRPSFSGAAAPEESNVLYEYFISQAKCSTLKVQAGCFGADMRVSLENNGPVTFLLEA